MTRLIGINKISVSEVDDTWYIAEIPSVEDGRKNSLCFYNEDGTTVSELEEVTYNPDIQQLRIDAGLDVVKDTVFSGDVLFKGNTYLPKNQVIENVSVKGVLNVNAITVFSGLRTVFTKAVTFNDSVTVSGNLNLTERTIECRIGSMKDKKGDVAIDSKYLYYCINDYDGTTNIWVRWSCDSQW